jgi:hypothetical protein
MSTSPASIHTVLVELASAWRQEKEINGFQNNIIIYVENVMESTKRAYIVEYKRNMKKLNVFNLQIVAKHIKAKF